MRSRWLTKPSAGLLVLGCAAVILAVIVYAAYHGSDAAVASECSPAHSLLHRALTDATAARSELTTTGKVTLSSAIARDDNDVNNFINGEQHPDSGFDGAILPLADALGRAATDLQATPYPGGTVADMNGLVAAATSAGQYCGISS